MAKKSRSKSSSPPFRVSPEIVSTGDKVMLRFAEPIRGGALPHVTIGGKPLDAPLLCDARTLVGNVPDDKPGTKAVRVDGLERALKAAAPLRHEGRRAGAKAGAPLHGVMHFMPHAFSPRPLRIPLRPGSIWYMLSANAFHDANAHVTMSVRLSNLWTRAAVTPYTFWYAESVLCDDAPVSGATTLFLAPFTSSGQGETLAAVDAATGTTRWTWMVASGRSHILSAPVCVNGRIFVARQFSGLSGQGPLMLVCGDANTGAILWDYQLQPLTYFGYVRLVAAYGSVFVLTDDGTLSAFDPWTGALLWQQFAAVPFRANIGRDESMAAAWGSVFVGSTNGLRAFDPRTGTPRWISSIAFDCSYSQILVTKGNPPLAIAADFAGSIYAVNALTGARVWDYLGNADWWPRMTCDFEHLYLQQTQTLVVLELPTGALREVSPNLGGDTSGGPTLCSNRIFQAIAPNPANPAGPSLLFVFDRSTVRRPVQKFVVNPTFIARPVVEGAQLYLNVSAAAASIFADYSVIQAIRIA